jgi:type I restriction enzyme S subunit
MIKIFQSAEKEIELLRKIVSQYRIQKRGLMQKLLTGKWRVGGVARTG